MAQVAIAQPVVLPDVPVANLGTISIRVVVLPPKSKTAAAAMSDDLPADLEEGEEFLLDKAATPLGSYLEHSKGKRCVVFLVNGQRQEALDNSFIVQELGFKYLRNRMMIVVDVDGLAPEAIGQIMQGSRQNFYRGQIWDAITRRIVAALKNEPDLERLEEEAEAQVSELKAGDEKVKQALDQLIDSHHDLGSSFAEGAGASGDNSGAELGLKTAVKDGVVTLLPTDKGQAADYPVLVAEPASSTLRIRPGYKREVKIKSWPSVSWSALNQLNIEVDKALPELEIRREDASSGCKVTILFREPKDFDTDQYPVRSKIKVTASFNGIKESRQLELSVLVKPDVEPPEPVLLDEPSSLKVSTRQPIQLRPGENDTHVRLRWDGKDRLLTGKKPEWKLSARLVEVDKKQPAFHFSEPTAGRLSLLISPLPEWKPGDTFKFEVTAESRRGRKLTVAFDAEVVKPKEVDPVEKGPRLVDSEFMTGSKRRPPYVLKVIDREQYGQPCWDAEGWTDADPGSYIGPTERAPLTLIINQDMEVLRDYRQELTKKNTEETVKRKVHRYTSHVAYHLYQMYQAAQPHEEVDKADARRREEIRRVAVTLVRLMDFGG